MTSVTRIGRVVVGGYYTRRGGSTAPAYKVTGITDRFIRLEEAPTPTDQLMGRALAAPRTVSVPVAAFRSLTPLTPTDPRIALL